MQRASDINSAVVKASRGAGPLLGNGGDFNAGGGLWNKKSFTVIFLS